MAPHESLLATSRSIPFPRIRSREIGLYDFGSDRSLLPGFGMKTTSALRKGCGWCPSLRAALQSAVRRLARGGHASRRTHID